MNFEVDRNMETSDAKNETAGRSEDIMLKRSQVEAQHRAEVRNESTRQNEVPGRQTEPLEPPHRLTSDELARIKVAGAESSVGRSTRDAPEQNPTEAALLKKINETPESERRAWEKAQFDRVRRPTPDELAKMKVAGAERSVGQSTRAAFEQNPTEAALLKKINETPESERRAWEKAQFDRVRRPAPDELARLKVDDGREAAPEKHEAIFEAKPEHVRFASAAESIEKIDDLKPEKWRELTPERRTLALRQAGRALRDAYDCPDPPLLPEKYPERNDGKILRGEYGDGATIDHPKRDYALKLNEELLRHDDPREALETYSHEFRHAYQSEMATRYEKPQFRNMVHDEDAASKWSENIRKYNDPEDDFAEYRKQAIEEDSREFSQKLVSLIYGKQS